MKSKWVEEILLVLNTLMAGQNGCYFGDLIFKCYFLNENYHIMLIQTSLNVFLTIQLTT